VSKAMSTFKVLIVGGSVAGMALANILERYRIDYELIEKHKIIAPQLGASIAMFPNGERILDQLGCLETIESLSMPVKTLIMSGPTGEQLANFSDFGEGMVEVLGYPMRFLDRRELIETLFQNLKDKSRVHTSANVLKVEISDSEVRIITKEGKTFIGSIVIGADGVHSQIKQEMWRLGGSRFFSNNSNDFKGPLFSS
jgi:2-polyprenyl-6-methoxyphenol hydroxylase-like FAD-dependent oxidoreductase